MKPLFSSLIAISALSLSACLSEGSTNIKGNWAIDMGRMTQQAQRMGASPRDLERLRKTYEGGQMHVTDNALILSITGISGVEELPYELISSKGSCHKLKVRIDKIDSSGQFCLREGFLEVKNLSAPGAVEIYRRVS